MRLVRTATISMLALSMALFLLHPAAAAGASKQEPTPIWLSQADLARLSSSIVDGSIACNLGFPGPPLSSIVYIIPPNDQFYTLVRPNGCAACSGADAARLSRIHIVLNFRRPCTIPIQYGIVANAGTDSCPFPNPGAQLCGLQTANLTADAAGAYDFPLTLQDSCRITGPSFLEVNFVTFPPACNNPNIDLLIGTTPMLVLINTCTQCASYNFFETAQDDLCIEPDALQGNPMMYAEAWSCYVPTFRRTWGQLKIRYR